MYGCCLVIPMIGFRSWFLKEISKNGEWRDFVFWLRRYGGYVCCLRQRFKCRGMGSCQKLAGTVHVGPCRWVPITKNTCVPTHNDMKYLFSLATKFSNCLKCIFIKYFELYLRKLFINFKKNNGFELYHRHGVCIVPISCQHDTARWILPVPMDT